MPVQDLIIEHSSSISSGISPSNSEHKFQSVFMQPYRGDTARLFVDTLIKEREAYSIESGVDTPYNCSISVVQSSGMGKSRMVEEAGNIVFTIPINLREEMVGGNLAYPPEDKNMRQFFVERQNKPDAVQQTEYAILLMELFAKAKDLVRTEFPGKTGQELARAWAKYLKVGQSDELVGGNRREFYDLVIDAAKTAILANHDKSLYEMEEPLRTSCKELLDLVHPDRSINENACIVYFDEAHTLTEPESGAAGGLERTPFHNLGTVLTKLVKCHVFFVFLSTNSHLGRLAQEAKTYPSARVTQGSQLIPPFTELPFDVYQEEILKEIDSLTLETVGKIDIMVKFGRPLWYSHRQASPGVDIFEFALNKLSRSAEAKYKDNSGLAALGVRVGITFDDTTAYSVQSDLVESHLRVVYSIPRHRKFMHTGAPSEPVLAEAAGWYFRTKKQQGLPIEGPKLLFEVSQKGFLARGERGELAGRLLLTSAHDIALTNKFDMKFRHSNRADYHRPIPVLDFLDALFHRSHHSDIHVANSVTGRGGKTLSEAFSHSYVFFSHFALAKDSEMLSQFGLATALVRGMALQAKDGQESIDAVIPIHMASPETRISPTTTSAINIQFKNRKGTPRCHVDRSITVPDLEMPVISIIFELGVKGKKADSIKIVSKSPASQPPRARSTHPDDHHYEIITRGCSSEIFGPIDAKINQVEYEGILGAGTILEDFPRWDNPRSVAAMEALKPAFSGKMQKEIYKAWTPETNGSGLGSVKPDSGPSGSESPDQEMSK